MCGLLKGGDRRIIVQEPGAFRKQRTKRENLVPDFWCDRIGNSQQQGPSGRASGQAETVAQHAAAWAVADFPPLDDELVAVKKGVEWHIVQITIRHNDDPATSQAIVDRGEYLIIQLRQMMAGPPGQLI